MPTVDDGLDLFLPAVARWFRATLGEPTPPQRLGWPAVAAGRNTLLFAPTGSGKTLAAFLACLDHLWRVPREAKGVRILYLSPLKALNNDVYRNLQVPLDGILQASQTDGHPLPRLSVAVRTGDTPQADRQRIVRHPPDILITTPESLHLMLTSQARSALGTLSHVIVDEIHSLCAEKRGVFLALLLERLDRLNPAGFVRVGLSATQRPLDEVARYLGGSRIVPSKRGKKVRHEGRPVTIIDAGQRKHLDLEVSAPFDRAGPRVDGSIWPAIERRLLALIREHRSTIIFANNRRVVERLTAHLNELAEAEAEQPSPTDPDDQATDFPVVARAHHGSLSQEERRATEDLLKAGTLPSVVATASLELGIDMGAVDLVCQVGSPGGVARGLQRVGRAGHLVGRTSKGRLIARTTGDLLEAAALTQAMIEGAVETLRVPTNCLDILAQQVVACVAVEPWDAAALFDFVRQAYPYRDLTAEAFEGVLKLVSGRFPTASFRDLQPRISWDRVQNRLAALPGTSRLAIMGGGTIPDTGQYPLYLGEGGPRIGELDEEFVLERRVGETFTLGTATWKIDAIEAQKVVVSRAEGQSAIMPFWRGEKSSRTVELGERVGTLCRDLAARIDDPAATTWLAGECRLDLNAARILVDHVARQIRVAGVVPDDRTIVVETFTDPSGEVGLAVLCPLGGKINLALKLALGGRLRQRLGITPACLHADDGLLLRLPRTVGEPPLDLFDGLTAGVGESLIRAELGESALFGLRFRQNAGRSLLMPRPDPSKRTPLWLQRLRAKDLLQVVRKLPDFPVVIETYRECLVDDLDLARFRQLLDAIEAGTVRVVVRDGQVASPFAADLVFRFTQSFLYQWDEPARSPSSAGEPTTIALLDGLLDPSAIGRVEARLRGAGHPPRTLDEMAETLRQLGDLAPSDLAGPMAGFLRDLTDDGRALAIQFSGLDEPDRWILTEDRDLYAAAFPHSGKQVQKQTISTSLGEISPAEATATVVRRYLASHALVGLDDLIRRYPLGPADARDLLERFADEGSLVRLDLRAGSNEPRWAERGNLDEVRRLSVAIRRRESVAVTPEVFADFILKRQCVHPSTRREGSVAVGLTIEQLQGFAAPAGFWESEILPRRVSDYRPEWLDEAISRGDWTWRAEADARGSDPRIAFVLRDFAGPWPSRGEEAVELTRSEETVLGHLTGRGACFVAEISQATGLGPTSTRAALDGLLRAGRVTNDRFDPLRPGGLDSLAKLVPVGDAPVGRPRFGRHRPSFGRASTARPEGRWTIFPPGPVLDEGPEANHLLWAAILIERYGVLTRETAASDPWAPPWRDLAPWLTRAEMRGEIRRGYFVEGLSGVQYATAEVVDALAQVGARSGTGSGAEAVLISSLDPANLYGSGAPLDIPLLEGGTARLPRNPNNHLILISGRPILIIEGGGKRLTGLASASELELRRAIALLPSLASPSRRVLKVETYNTAATLASPAAPWLADVGFVRDPPGMAYYHTGW